MPDYAPAESVLVNVDRISRLAFLGGMESLRIDSYAGDTTQVIPETDSVYEKGIATASLKGVISRAETQKSDALTPGALEVPEEYRWSRGTVSLNISEIDERVGTKGHLRDPKEWSRQLDKALRAGIRESSWSSLISASRFKSMPAVILGTGIFTNAGVYGDRGTELAAYTAAGYTITSLFALHVIHKWRGHDVSYRDCKHSIMPGLPLDRFFAVNALSRTRSLIKAQYSPNAYQGPASSH